MNRQHIGARGKRNEVRERGFTTGPLPLTPDPEPKREVRLQKVIAQAGVASRRKAEAMIAEGRVSVNGRTLRELGVRVDPQRDHVKVDGRHLKPSPPPVYLILHKPKGYVSSLNDPAGRPTISDLLAGVRLRVFPVGRLDFESEGLMLLTNHGEMAERLLHPRYHVPKTYLTKVKGVLSREKIAVLERGISLEEGQTKPATVKKMGIATENSWLEIRISEGRKHQIRRMLEAVGHPVLKLKRVRFGPLALGGLPPGRYRYLTDAEANALRSVMRSRDESTKDGQRARSKGKGARGRVPVSSSRFRVSNLSLSVLGPQSSVLGTPGLSPLASCPAWRRKP